MRFARLLTVAAFAVLAFVMLPQAKQDTKPATDSDTNGIVWYTYQEGWAKAKAEKKHMFVDFTATWCGWCKKLEKNTFSQPEIIKSLNTDFVPVKVWDNSTAMLDIDGYKISEKDLIRKEFKVRGYPALWFVSPEGVRVGPAGGYIEADRLKQVLDIVKNYRYDSTRTESGEKINPDEKDTKK
jgi:thioredoxin-related protein